MSSTLATIALSAQRAEAARQARRRCCSANASPCVGVRRFARATRLAAAAAGSATDATSLRSQQSFRLLSHTTVRGVAEPLRATLTIRISPALHRSLAAVADAEGESMNAVAEAALSHEVARRAATLAESYERATEAMRDRARLRLAEAIDEIAADESTTSEPVPTRHHSAVPATTFEAISARARRVR